MIAEFEPRIFSLPHGFNKGGYKDDVPTVTTSKWQYNHLLHEFTDDGAVKSMRRLTPLEVERLFGLPDHYTAEGIAGPLADTNRYRLLGNSVVVPMFFEVAQRIVTANDQRLMQRHALPCPQTAAI
jgi:site-specific DNA-cytosine methylase